jgi:beta-mannosidase
MPEILVAATPVFNLWPIFDKKFLKNEKFQNIMKMISKRLSRFIITAISLIMIASCGQTGTDEISLSGNNWRFRQAGGSTWLKATVPGTVHIDLLHHGLIPDPFIGKNDDLVQWVEKEDWEYRKVFRVPASMLKQDAVVLELEGLDTYADIFLNGQKILEADNMYLGYEIDVKDLLKKGKNELLVYFHSPVKLGLQKLQQLDYLLQATSEQAPEAERTSIFTRKAPFHYGWDWGPRLVTSGIWRPAKLKAWSHARITEPTLETDTIGEDMAIVRMNVMLDLISEGDYALVTRLNGVETSRIPLNGMLPGQFPVSQLLPITEPRLWWPNGLGEPTLYQVEFVLEKDGRKIGSHSLPMGIRTIKLVQEPDEIGASFHFEVNGVPVFMKGANVIPSDPLTPRVTEETYRRLINDAVEANLNMLRVWGGAIYEEEIFYRLCDEHGLLVWQDFMFACALQPGDEAHLENIRKEAEYNVKRLRNHPSIALWCGNNENLTAWYKWGWKEMYTPEQADFIWRTYERIYYEILPQAVARHDPKTAYHSSSPASINNTVADRRSGDEHDWTIWFSQAPLSAFAENVPRFVSEYGLQAIPKLETLRYFAGNEPLELYSPILMHRQRSRMDWFQPGFTGNHMIEYYAQQYFPEAASFEELAYVSQLVQAKGYKMATEAHRRNMPHCMGSLYWQLNDTWPTTSWATVDFFGNWKASHYAIRKANQAVIASPAIEDGLLKVYVVSDLLTDILANLDIIMIDHAGNLQEERILEIKVKGNQSNVAFAESLESLLPPNLNDWIILTRLTAEGISHENILFPVRPRELEFKPLPIEYKVFRENGEYLIELMSEGLIKGLFIETGNEKMRLSDNYFDLLPGIPKVISAGRQNPGALQFTSLNSIRSGEDQVAHKVSR